MNVDYLEFIIHGVFGDVQVGTPWPLVKDILHEPNLYEPPSASSPGFAKYGDLEFTIEDSLVSIISLVVDGAEVELPSSISMIDFEDPCLDVDEMKEVLGRREMPWQPMGFLSDDWYEYFRTEAGVHLVFGGGLLVKVSAADPGKYRVPDT